MSTLLAAAKQALKQMCKAGCPGVDELDEAITAVDPTSSFADTLDGTKWRRLIAFRDVSVERNKQDEQWGGPRHDDEHSSKDFLGFIAYQGTRATAYANVGDEGRQRFVKIAALAIAAIESIDRKAGAR